MYCYSSCHHWQNSTSQTNVMLNNEEMKLVALSIVKLYLAEGFGQVIIKLEEKLSKIIKLNFDSLKQLDTV